jgi:hypothetical protein
MLHGMGPTENPDDFEISVSLKTSGFPAGPCTLSFLYIKTISVGGPYFCVVRREPTYNNIKVTSIHGHMSLAGHVARIGEGVEVEVTLRPTVSRPVRLGVFPL